MLEQLATKHAAPLGDEKMPAAAKRNICHGAFRHQHRHRRPAPQSRRLPMSHFRLVYIVTTVPQRTETVQHRLSNMKNVIQSKPHLI